MFIFIATNAVMAALDHFRANSIYIWQLVRCGWRLINSVTGDRQYHRAQVFNTYRGARYILSHIKAALLMCSHTAINYNAHIMIMYVSVMILTDH